jgi:tRNA-specific 2-thiouridylase
MDLCFVAKGESYREVLARSGMSARAGRRRDRPHDRRACSHPRRVTRFTVGQRRGLGVATGEKLFVIGIDAPRSASPSARSATFTATRVSVERVRWIPFDRRRGFNRGRGPDPLGARGHPATIRDDGDGRATVTFSSPQRAITSGQAAVFYDGDLVLGGGWIAS